MAITDTQRLVNARESFALWMSFLPDSNLIPLYPLLGCEAGETGFDFRAIGDHDAAFGPFQHHLPRILFIRDHIQIDIRTASHTDQLRAAFWEMSSPMHGNPYGHVWDALLASTSEMTAMTVLVRNYEQSKNQASDIAKRLTLGLYWKARLAI